MEPRTPEVTRRLLQSVGEQGGTVVSTVDALDDGAGLARPLRCARCGHAITTTSARVAVNGQHEHTGVNMHGWVHRYGCFSTAPGCASQGVPSRQHTWFADHFWHVQICAGCGEHLGWLFFHDAASPGFYGLLVDALVEGSDEAKA